MELPAGEVAAFALAVTASGAVAGLMAGIFGIGGGAILVPVFYQVFGLLGVDDLVRMHLSVGSSLAIIVPTSLRSCRAHVLRGAVDMKLLRSFVVAVPAGVVAASLTAAFISSAGLRAVFAVILFLVGLKLLFNRRGWRIGDTIPGNPVRSLVGFFIGYLSTLMGIGGGILNNTFMTLFGRPIHQAVATSSGVGVLISVPGFLGYIWAGWGLPQLPVASTGYVNWIAVILVIPVTLLVAPLGVRIAHALNKRHLEIAFGLFALFVSARFAWSLL
ncbi:sulfite exporter TauE/SafE family protein [Chelativorans salis]|uniref:Probable membrane transporter protein n=1 Tax=Chelativorans salis TaxID=2978478 RepID=A0ABT2LLS0_9HYPH|nr:sulfite exporter TauE/SafE family protein [Chelativorans sp. EGI FJ00035]MCT7375536.1 sulfite exporter TauE/SafE family protein [Chelativorans sp. EGI FJ00035]